MRSYKLESVSDFGNEFTLISSDGTKFTTNGYKWFNEVRVGDWTIGSCLTDSCSWNETEGQLQLDIIVSDEMRELILFEVNRIVDKSEYNNFSEIYDAALEECVSFLRTHVSNINGLIDKLWDEV